MNETVAILKALTKVIDQGTYTCDATGIDRVAAIRRAANQLIMKLELEQEATATSDEEIIDGD